MADDHLIPNTTQVPNSILDLLMPFLHDAETRILLYLCRRTYGFERHSDSVSLAQFTDGIRGESRQLDFGAGVSRRAAISALNILKDIGIVEQLEGGQGRSRIPVYRVNRKCEMVHWLHLISQDTENARGKIVQRLHLIREKHAPRAPISVKPKEYKELEDKVQEKHLLEKVQITTEKGANEFLENRDSSGLDAHTKPSITKPRKKTKDSLSSADADESSAPTPRCQELVDAWNTICAGHARLPRKELISPSLRKKILSRLKEHPEAEFWEIVLNKCVDSRFLSGRKTSWRATLDWLVRNDSNAIQVYEGDYDDER